MRRDIAFLLWSSFLHTTGRDRKWKEEMSAVCKGSRERWWKVQESEAMVETSLARQLKGRRGRKERSMHAVSLSVQNMNVTL